MTDQPTAIKARLLPYKGLQDSLRITLEVPLELAGSVTTALGWPSPSEEIWVGVVRLNNEEKPPYLHNVPEES